MMIAFISGTLVFLNVFSVAMSKLTILSPPQLVKAVKEKHPQGIPYSVANYGDVPFGTILGGSIYLPSVLENCIYQPLDESAQTQINKIVLSERGDCTFTTKSINSQKQGAKMAVIVDNKTNENPGRIVLVDDRRGTEVKIPTVFIQYWLGELIQKYIIQQKQQVKIFVQFRTNKGGISYIDIWMDSQDRESYLLIRKLKSYLIRIKDKTRISLYHQTIKCSYCRASDCYGDKEFCKNTGYIGRVVKDYGRELINEQLRQEFIMKKHSVDGLWWEYINEFDDQCDEKTQLEECSLTAMKKVGIDSDQIVKMVKRSFKTVEKTNPDTNQTYQIIDNGILRANEERRMKQGVIVYPGIIVNDITYRGNLDALDIFELVCNSFEKKPEGCNLAVAQPGTPWVILLIVGLSFLVFLIFIIVCYRRKVRRELSKDINKQVNELVSQYITMYEVQKFEKQ